MKTFLVAMLLLAAGGVHLEAQLIEEIYNRSDSRTLRERAHTLIRKGGQDSLAMKFLERWLSAVPFDTSAAKDLKALYVRNGRVADAKYADSIVIKRRHRADPRTLTIKTLQVRYGSYQVIMPANVKPTETYPAVLVLHGNGNNPEVMMNWVRTLKMDSVIFLFPEAPYPKLHEIMAIQHPVFSASGRGLGLPDSLFAGVIDASAAWYHDVYIDASTKLPISRRKPVIIGFSQGGFYAYVVASRYPQDFRSIISISASMYAEGQVEGHLDDLRLYGVDVLVAHGKSDKVVPFQTAELISAMLSTARIEHEVKPYEGGHWPSKTVSKYIRTWLIDRLR